jgi:glucose-6-phosphate isomerase
MSIKINIDRVLDFVSLNEIEGFQDKITKSHTQTLERTGKGSDFLGWVTLPEEVPESLFTSIENTAALLREKAEIFVVIGIGGSYLGARAVIEALNHHFSMLQPERKNPLILYAGHHIDEDYQAELLEILDKYDYALTVISKSGTTTEPAIAFRILKNHLEAKYGKEEARTRIVAITDKAKGALKTLADKEGYQTYVVPDDVGGRYSVLSPVGLLPIAVAGFDVRKLVAGARAMQGLNVQSPSLEENPMALYAAVRNALYNKGKEVEVLVNYHPRLFYFTEWWKQLYGESEGKEGKGIFPAGVGFTTDLHSMGQYIQDGRRFLFETVLAVEKPVYKLQIPTDEQNLDGLNYLAGRGIHEVNRMAELGTMIAHVDGGVPNIHLSIPEISEVTLGELVYFFEMGCALSGYTLGVNPFDQPGVEAYKKNMFALLGKPGHEEETRKMQKYL